MNRNLWAPWRMAYIRDLESQVSEAKAGTNGPESGGNFIAQYWQTPQDDEANHVVYRDSKGIVFLNRYPYANGHLLVALGDPRPRLSEYEPRDRAAFWSLVDLAIDLVDRELRPQGMNVGLNVGRSAGAGLPEHVHAHVVPRWAGDTNFLSVVGEVRVIPEALASMASAFRKSLASAAKRA